MANARVQRGRETEDAVAEFLRGFPGWSDAARRPASLPGSDIMGVPFDVECKATKDFSPTTWKAQQDQRRDNDQPAIVVYRPNGYGPATVAQWPTFTCLAEMAWLLHLAGF